ncbi:DUF3830 family protein [Nocardioides sp. LHD-245]|uniref:DUF3830 family protein n=1 Tax=Nocardioides sp. LHD-245 TaxID=3051387 RepID=UPI0027DFF21D|nr:DUF3830 family protein [Nocardioides sp. LHD-245]
MTLIDIEFTGQGKTFQAALLEESAPQTCTALRAMLGESVTGASYHSIYSGQEFYVYCPPVDLPLENHVVWPKRGQIVYYFFPENMYSGMHVHQDRIQGDGAEIALWYGHGDLRIVTETGIRGNLFAEVLPEQLDDFYAAGDHILAHGREDIVIRMAG